MNLSALEVYNFPYKKRIGKDNDGGYVIITDTNILKKEPQDKESYQDHYDVLLSAGISDDISFEIDFLKYFTHTEQCFAFDGTITSLPQSQENVSVNSDKIQFIRKNIAHINTDTTDNLQSYIADYKDIFLKMDIEGSEYQFFAALSTTQMQSFKQIVVEFHFPTQSTEIWSILNKIKETHWLVHLHPNNNCGFNKYTVSNTINVDIPNVFECTYIRKPFLSLSTESVPRVDIDMPNNPDKPEIVLTGYPYNTL